MPTRRLLIRGLVQGVWFRESMRQEALRLGITGWVRNLRDGSVEAVVSGEDQAVERMIAWARRGPDTARVEQVQVTVADGDFDRFEKLPTA
jgi:acylphosphatase